MQEVPRDWLIVDIGPATVTLFGEALQNAKTIIWNGPMGAFEYDAFSRGTMAMVQKVADSYALTIVGGGDTDVALHKAGEFQKFSYVSTGGGAFIELLEGKKLPGIHGPGNMGQEASRCLNACPSSPATGRCTRPWPRPGPWPGRFGRGVAGQAPAGGGAGTALHRPDRGGRGDSPAPTIGLAAQDTFWERAGAFTGAISPWMLQDAGCRYVIVGHSERRQHFGDTNQTVNRKLKPRLAAGLRLIFCVGETREEREAGTRPWPGWGSSSQQGLAGLTGATGENLVVAYEPVWAIGTGSPPPRSRPRRCTPSSAAACGTPGRRGRSHPHSLRRQRHPG